MLITGAYNCLNKNNMNAETRYLYEQVVDNETTTTIANVIRLCVRNGQKRQRLSLAGKTQENVGTWVNNLSCRPLPTEKHNGLKMRLDFSLRDASPKECLAELERPGDIKVPRGHNKQTKANHNLQNAPCKTIQRCLGYGTQSITHFEEGQQYKHLAG